MWAIAKKDLKALFYSPIGYVVMAVFLAAMGIIMYVLTLNARALDFNLVYEKLGIYVLPVISALLAMKAFSEEKSNDTEKLILTASRNAVSMIIGKILAIFIFVSITVGISFFYCILFAQYGAINSRLLITILSLLLLTIAYASVGVMVSSLTENQVISAILTAAFLLLPAYFSFGDGAFSYLALSKMYAAICEGQLSIKSIIAFISFSATCVLLSSIEMKRNKKFN